MIMSYVSKLSRSGLDPKGKLIYEHVTFANKIKLFGSATKFKFNYPQLHVGASKGLA